MTIKEISGKLADKDKRVSEVAEKIKAVESEMESLDQQKQSSVQSGAPDKAIELMRAIRDKEDELKILCQVRDNLTATPAATQGEFLEAWNAICTELMAEYEKEVLPELQSAYSRYCQAVEAVAALRQKAQAPAAQIEQMAKGQGFNMVLPSPFLGVELNKYYPDKTVSRKLNCLDSGMLNNPLTRISCPISILFN